MITPKGSRAQAMTRKKASQRSNSFKWIRTTLLLVYYNEIKRIIRWLFLSWSFETRFIGFFFFFKGTPPKQMKRFCKLPSYIATLSVCTICYLYFLHRLFMYCRYVFIQFDTEIIKREMCQGRWQCMVCTCVNGPLLRKACPSSVQGECR